MKIVGYVLGTVVALFVVMMIIGANADPEKQKQRDAIALCWKEQERKSLTPGAARSIAGVCEKMENDFRAKWRVNP